MKSKFFYYAFWILFGWFLGSLTMYGCATLEKYGVSIDIKDPTTRDLMLLATNQVGYIVGSEEPELAGEFIHYTGGNKEDPINFFENWKRYLAYKLIDKPRYQRLVEHVLKLVNIELEGETVEDQAQIIKELFAEFIDGLQTGINANLPK